MKFKKIWVVLLAAILILTASVPVLADSGDEVITMEQALAMGRANSRTLKTLQLNEEKLKLAYEMTKSQYTSADIRKNIKAYEDLIDKAVREGAPSALIAGYEAKISALKQMIPAGSVEAEAKYDSVKYAYEDIEKQIENAELSMDYSLEKLYFALLDIEQSIETLEKSLELTGSRLQISRLSLSLGLSTNFDEKSAVIEYNEIYTKLNQLKDTRRQLIWQLNDILGRSVDLDFKTAPFLISPLNFPADYNKIAAAAMENYLALAQQERVIKDSKGYAKDSETGKQKRIYRYDVEVAELGLEEMKDRVRQNVKTLIDSLQSSYYNWETARLAKEKAEIAYQHNQLKYQEGMISAIQLAAGELEYLQALDNERKAAEGWHLAKHQLELAEKGIFLEA